MHFPSNPIVLSRQFMRCLPYGASLCLLPLLLVACGNFTKQGGMAARNETYSFAGPGRERIERGKFPKVSFAEDSAKLTSAETAKLKSVSIYLRENSESRLLIVGFARDPGTAEYNRVLGEQRAQVVRDALVAGGVSGDRLQTLSLGGDVDGGAGQDGRCVELGIVR
jgi:peptidoglycan-associated lipoprotein